MFYFYLHCFIFNTIFALKVTYSYWLIMIFFFLLKKIPNVLIIQSLITSFCFFNLKRFILLILLSSISFFFSLKRFVTSLMLSFSSFFSFLILSSLFYLFEALFSFLSSFFFFWQFFFIYIKMSKNSTSRYQKIYIEREVVYKIYRNIKSLVGLFIGFF